MKNRTLISAYTVVELMIAAAVIVVIAGIAIPSWMRARQNAQKGGLINEIRTTSEAFINYAADNNNSPNGGNNFPPTPSGFSVVPTGMAQYMPKNSTWTSSPDGGGLWFWVNVGQQNGNDAQPVDGFTELIVLYNPGLPTNMLQEIDSFLDDGNLNSGAFQLSGTTLFYGVQ